MAKKKVVMDYKSSMGEGFDDAVKETMSSDNPDEMILRMGWKGYYWLMYTVNKIQQSLYDEDKIPGDENMWKNLSEKELHKCLEELSAEERRLMHNTAIMIQSLIYTCDGAVWKYFSDVQNWIKNHKELEDRNKATLEPFFDEKKVEESFWEEKEPPKGYRLARNPDSDYLRKLFQQTTFPPVMKKKKTNGK